MKKVIILIGVLLINIPTIFSQIIKIENGLSISSMTSNKSGFDLFDNNIYSYSMSVGCDYWEHKFFNLSSELGYNRKGGKSDFILTDASGNAMSGLLTNKSDYLHINTTFRLRYPYKNTHFFIGFGPKLDFLIKTNTYPIELDGYKFNKVLFGFKPEIGFQEAIGNKYVVGFNVAYLINLSSVVQSEYADLCNNTFLFKFSVGYRL